MANYSYIIVDDEMKAIRLLEKIITQHYSNLHMAGSYTTWETALEALKGNDFDLLFLDISMPHKSGLSLLEFVPGLDCEIIFVTAHEEHALKALNFSPSGYILKPIKDVKLVATINKAIKRVQDKKMAEHYTAEKEAHAKNKIGIRNNNGVDYVDIDDILFFEATTRYTKVVTGDKTYLSSYSIGKFRAMLDSHNFYMVHRSFIVNINRIKRYESTGILIMDKGQEIPVAKNTREEFLKLFNRV